MEQKLISIPPVKTLNWSYPTPEVGHTSFLSLILAGMGDLGTIALSPNPGGWQQGYNALMKIPFLHTWQSIPGGAKQTLLVPHGHEVVNPALLDDDFHEAVRIAKKSSTCTSLN